MRRESEKSQSANLRKPLAAPQPGEIWEISRHLQYYGEFSPTAENQFYSTAAQSFLRGETPPRYVMIITEPEAEIVSVMVLSTETNFISDINLLIPAQISGSAQDLLAETWHVQPMLVSNLLQPVGQRLSRKIYDVLLTVGDYYHGLVDQQLENHHIEKLGLKLNATTSLDINKITLFHQQEQDWSDVLTISVAAYHTYIKTVNFTDKILQEQIDIEQELAEFESTEHKFITSLATALNKTHTILSRWTQNIFEPEWQNSSQLPKFAVATRSARELQHSPLNPDEITAIIQQLSSTNDEKQRQRAAKDLGEVAVGNSDAIQALVNLLRSTADDETLWIAVESLRKLDPANQAAGIRRIKLIDLGIEIAGKDIALAVAFLHKIDGDVSVLLQIYPTGNHNYLPPDLKLILLDNSGNILREVIARCTDIYIQLKFSCTVGEAFTVQIALGETNFSEDFVM
ncbi:DUF1822 family protein [Nostoc sp. CMAA1605]|uniref:DUF1822 family protein n=1 Tax=Nostoc sp. CMAA1605 TaxID=2055159 RepID=UPI001F47D46A|nr:DUF1822 family protein [Nostoc sp. CMAA1605]MCF4967455.1 hypothetical protein [Nostoc sp. CMAA1605]